MAMWLEEERLDVDRLVGTFGNVPGELIRFWAKMLKPVENFVGAYVNLCKSLDNDRPCRGWQAINRWVEDVIPLSGGALRQFVVDYVRDNELIKGQHEVKGQQVDLSNIRASLLNIVAQYDHLVAPSQSQSIMDLVSSKDKELRVIPSTHVGLMASSRARYKLWPELAEWLAPTLGPVIALVRAGLLIRHFQCSGTKVRFEEEHEEFANHSRRHRQRRHLPAGAGPDRRRDRRARAASPNG